MKKSLTLVLGGLLFILVIAIGVTFSFSKSEEVKEEIEYLEGARIYVPESSFDWGYSVNRQHLTHKYPIINIGTDTLRIINVRTTCGCTKRQMGKTAIASGETTSVTLEFRTGGYKGKQRKSAYVTTNDTTNPRIQLSFTAMLDSVTQRLVPEPKFYHFGQDYDNDRETKIMIYNKFDDKIELDIIDYPYDFVTEIEIKDKKIPSGGATELFIKINDEFEPGMYMTGSVTLEASDSSHTRLTIPIKVVK